MRFIGSFAQLIISGIALLAMCLEPKLISHWPPPIAALVAAGLAANFIVAGLNMEEVF